MEYIITLRSTNKVHLKKQINIFKKKITYELEPKDIDFTGLKKKESVYKITMLPTKIEKITLNRSPHIFSKSKEQFEIRRYSVNLKIRTELEDMDLKCPILGNVSTRIIYNNHEEIYQIYHEVPLTPEQEETLKALMEESIEIKLYPDL